MSTAGPWSVKGIDPKAREIAKDLARRSGMTLGEWLNHMIIEGDDPAETQAGPPEPAFDRPWLDAPRTRSQAAAFSATESLRQRLQRDLAGRGEPAPPPPIGHNSEAGDLQRLARAIAALSERIENGERRTTLSISGMDQQVVGVLARVEGAERDQGALAARVDVGLEEVRAGQDKLNERLRRFDADESGRMEAIHALESALNKVAGQIYEGEGRARVAMQELREDVAALARRVDRAEGEGGSPGERRLEAMVSELTRRLDEVRSETQARIKDASDGKLDRLEGVLRDVVAKVGESEKRSAEAVDRIGREVMRVAQTMGSRVQAVEQRSAQASEQMGSEMTRIAEAMEGRLRRADAAQAEALDKLSAEISRIAEKLADRIAASERRSAGAMTHMGDQLSGVTERLNQKNDQTSAEIAERIRASEERTAKLLAETRESIDRRLGGLGAQGVSQAFGAAESPIARAPAPALEAAASPFSAPSADPFGDPFDAGPAEAHEPAFDAFAAEPLALDDPFASPSAEAEAAPAATSRSTRDVIASARAAARAASGGRGRKGSDPFGDPPGFESPDFAAAPFGAGASEYTAPEIEAAASRARSGALGFGFPLPKRKKKDGATLKTLLMASGVAAALSVTAVGAVGLVALDGKAGAKGDKQTPTAAPDPKAAIAAAEKSAVDPLAFPGDDQAAVAISPDAAAAAAPAPAAPPVVKPAQPIASAPQPAPPAPGQPQPRTIYSAAVRQIEGGDASGVEALRKAANLGYAPAQFYLAKLYENGGSGLKKDPAEARRWTERAAQGGDAKAMHNLALYWFEGSGGPKDAAQAADWFKRAAERGVQDSQYNLARLYEQGYGVPKNAAEAYKWYLVAGAAGDADSRTGADTVKRSLSPEAQAAAERAAQTFRTQIAASALRTATTE